MLTVPERTAEVSEHFAEHDAHGYSQPNRGGGVAESYSLSDGSKVTTTNRDVDCSEMVRECVNAALTGSYRGPIAYMWTGNEDEQLREQGFKRIAFDPSRVRRGDVLWMAGHTGIALGNGLQADAHGDEYGGISGPNAGDQTGCEVEIRELRTSWTYIYRYTGGEQLPSFYAATFRVEITGSCNTRTAPSMADGAKTGKRLQAGDAVTCDGFCFNEGHVWGTYIGGSTSRRIYVSLGEQHEWLAVP